MNYTEHEVAYMCYTVMLLLEIFRNPECGLHCMKLYAFQILALGDNVSNIKTGCENVNWIELAQTVYLQS